MRHTCRTRPAMSWSYATSRCPAQVALLLTLALAATSTVAAQRQAPDGDGKRGVPAVVEQPRPFGYVVGDVVTQRVLLATARQEFEPTSLPPAQRVNVWFERRASRIEVTSDKRRWLVVDYQLINAPPKLTTAQLPAWTIEDKAHGVRLAVPAASISVSPLISEASSAEIRPDREVSTIDPAPARMGIIAWAIALAITLIAWLAWAQWRNWQDSRNRPFARALRELRRTDEMAPEAWQALHRAFDQTAGRVLQIETLPTLFDRAPHLQPRRAEIERFFAQSNQRFFGTGSSSGTFNERSLDTGPASDTINERFSGAGSANNPLSVRSLCHELRRIERRHAP